MEAVAPVGLCNKIIRAPLDGTAAPRVLATLGAPFQVRWHSIRVAGVPRTIVQLVKLDCALVGDGVTAGPAFPLVVASFATPSSRHTGFVGDLFPSRTDEPSPRPGPRKLGSHRPSQRVGAPPVWETTCCAWW